MCYPNSCALATVPFFAAFQYSDGNGQAERMFPDFQLKVLSSACCLSLQSCIKFPSDFTNGALAGHRCHFKVSP